MSVAFSKVNKQAHISKRAVCWLTELSAVIVSAGEIFSMCRSLSVFAAAVGC